MGDLVRISNTVPVATDFANDKPPLVENFSNGDLYTIDVNGNVVKIGPTVAAPVGADYLVKTADATLTAERVVTDTATITWDWATAGQAKANYVGSTGLVYTDKSANFNVTGSPAGFKITANSVTATLSATPTNNDYYEFVFSTGSITGAVIARNGKKIMGLAEDMTIDDTSIGFGLVYDSTSGDWRLV